ncbi:hypothetical protein VFPFJ_02689 [Purpureocillium lilacinum]|uniref:Secreted protein n=1 Tax=Purpureocillium lilacinum TaxID=33203 RepID=A0A179GNJ5_PURLI|nr:hypothetical protein VFPFJ_02689 [Purpureocillium lilacinum]OAQ78729.1 hypothetical protein VFPBJ_06850 [Purpureocillium lilacinum]OAQ93527.1 hypothetical protein VFPFJ_02689 [Purpureocillium lilacinum]
MSASCNLVAFASLLSRSRAATDSASVWSLPIETGTLAHLAVQQVWTTAVPVGHTEAPSGAECLNSKVLLGARRVRRHECPRLAYQRRPWDQATSSMDTFAVVSWSAETVSMSEPVF